MVRTEASAFKDEQGRTLYFRGASFSGASKIPSKPDGSTHKAEDFFRHKEVSFTDRPLPLDSSTEFFSGFIKNGFNCLRLVVPWEALEHSGPEEYDEDFIKTIKSWVLEAERFQVYVIIDAHQDAFSRFSGGSGAPAWALEKAGFLLSALSKSESAILHHELQDKFESELTYENYRRFASATMFTLFFAGDVFAPKLSIDGQNSREYFQSHYIAAYKKLAYALRTCSNVLGFEAMNEPSRGFIACKDLGKKEVALVKNGFSLSPLDTMILADGHSVNASYVKHNLFGLAVYGKKLLNPSCVRAYRDASVSIWKAEGVWTDEKGSIELLKKEYFSYLADGTTVDFQRDFLCPFISRFTLEIRKELKEAIIFVQGEVFSQTISDCAGNLHDTAFLCTYPNYEAELLHSKKESSNDLFYEMPVILRNVKASFNQKSKHTNLKRDYKSVESIFKTYFDTIDKYLLSALIWNISPDNTHEHGDHWNKENYSIFCAEDSGYRAQKGYVRPYAQKISGSLTHQSFDVKNDVYCANFKAHPFRTLECEFFIPEIFFHDDYSVTFNQVPTPKYIKKPEEQKLIVITEAGELAYSMKIQNLS